MRQLGLSIVLALALFQLCQVSAEASCSGDDCSALLRDAGFPYITPRSSIDPFEQARQNEATEYRNQHPTNTYETPLTTPPSRTPSYTPNDTWNNFDKTGLRSTCTRAGSAVFCQ
jgi:hypothetical protein